MIIINRRLQQLDYSKMYYVELTELNVKYEYVTISTMSYYAIIRIYGGGFVVLSLYLKQYEQSYQWWNLNKV